MMYGPFFEKPYACLTAKGHALWKEEVQVMTVANDVMCVQAVLDSPGQWSACAAIKDAAALLAFVAVAPAMAAVTKLLPRASSIFAPIGRASFFILLTHLLVTPSVEPWLQLSARVTWNHSKSMTAVASMLIAACFGVASLLALISASLEELTSKYPRKVDMVHFWTCDHRCSCLGNKAFQAVVRAGAVRQTLHLRSHVIC
eukprot:7390940-Prymnesium_polylepis.1